MACGRALRPKCPIYPPVHVWEEGRLSHPCLEGPLDRARSERGGSGAVAAEYDLPLIALKAQSGAVDRLPLPAIVHCQNPGTDGGHYLVLLRVNTDGTLTILEGTTGRLERWSKGDFYDQWTGVVLVRSDRWDSKRLDPLMAFSSGLGLLIAIACFMRVRRTARARDKAV